LPSHQDAFRPEDLLDFIELPVFSRRWAKLGLDDEGDLSALQLSIMAAPHKAKVIKGTAGIRKMRFSPRDGASAEVARLASSMCISKNSEWFCSASSMGRMKLTIFPTRWRSI
jgi:hypothetical protein